MMNDDLKTVWARRAAVRCEGMFQSAVTIENIYHRYKRYATTRNFYKMLCDMLDHNIELLATFTDNLRKQEVFPNKFMEGYMTKSQEKNWQVLEDICNHVKATFGEDWWNNPQEIPNNTT